MRMRGERERERERERESLRKRDREEKKQIVERGRSEFVFVVAQRQVLESPQLELRKEI